MKNESMQLNPKQTSEEGELVSQQPYEYFCRYCGTRQVSQARKWKGTLSGSVGEGLTLKVFCPNNACQEATQHGALTNISANSLEGLAFEEFSKQIRSLQPDSITGWRSLVLKIALTIIGARTNGEVSVRSA